jgi:hypothetical protein
MFPEYRPWMFLEWSLNNPWMIPDWSIHVPLIFRTQTLNKRKKFHRECSFVGVLWLCHFAGTV